MIYLLKLLYWGYSMFPFKSSSDFLEYVKTMEIHTLNCPLSSSLDLISGKWELKILFLLLKYDTLRFGEFKKNLPNITNTVLTNVLKKFEKAEVIHRTQFNEIPPHVEYSLTESGKELIHVFFELAKWGQKISPAHT